MRGGERISSLSRERIQLWEASSATRLRKRPKPMKGEVWIFTLGYLAAISRVESVDPVSKRITSSKEMTESSTFARRASESLVRIVTVIIRVIITFFFLFSPF